VTMSRQLDVLWLLGAKAPEVVDNWLGPLDRFVEYWYNGCVNDPRKELFTQIYRAVDGLPRTHAAQSGLLIKTVTAGHGR